METDKLLELGNHDNGKEVAYAIFLPYVELVHNWLLQYKPKLINWGATYRVSSKTKLHSCRNADCNRKAFSKLTRNHSIDRISFNNKLKPGFTHIEKCYGCGGYLNSRILTSNNKLMDVVDTTYVDTWYENGTVVMHIYSLCSDLIRRESFRYRARFEPAVRFIDKLIKMINKVEGNEEWMQKT